MEKYGWTGCLKDYWNINWMSGMFDYDTKLIPPDPDFFSAGISIDSDDKWDQSCLQLCWSTEELLRYIIKEREEIFTGAQRSNIVWQILLRTPYDTARPDKAGIVRLMNKNVYEACFPLHEGRYDRDGPQGEKSDRRGGPGLRSSGANTGILLSALVSPVGEMDQLLQIDFDN